MSRRASGLGPRASGRNRSGRIVAAIACALVTGCGRAEAVPGQAGPAGWTAIDGIAKAAGDSAKGDGVKVEAASAWGDPARGCYAVALELSGAGASEDAQAKQVADGAAAAGLAVKDVATTGGVLTLTFTHAPYTGHARAELAKTGHIAARACFWNEREPAACEAACAGWLR